MPFSHTYYIYSASFGRSKQVVNVPRAFDNKEYSLRGAKFGKIRCLLISKVLRDGSKDASFLLQERGVALRCGLQEDLSKSTRPLFKKHKALIQEAQGAYLGSTRRLFRKHRALISEARGAYSGSTGRLFKKHEALIPEAQGAYSGSTGRLFTRHEAFRGGYHWEFRVLQAKKAAETLGNKIKFRNFVSVMTHY